METITQYKAKDGKLFSDRTECERHETELNKPKAPAKPLGFEPKILARYGPSKTFMEALELSEKEGKRLLTNLEADEILQNPDAYAENKSLFPCWTGLLLVYEMPGVPFGKFVKDAQTGWVFDIPKKYQGQKNMALVLEQKNFKIEKGEYDLTLVKATKMDAIPFPERDGWYISEEKYGIPSGEKSEESNPKARYLWRITDSDPIHPVARYDFWGGYDGRRVNCYLLPDSGRLGVGVVEPSPSQKAKR